MSETIDLILSLSKKIKNLKAHIDLPRLSRADWLTDTWIDNQDILQTFHISKITLPTFCKNIALPYSKVQSKFYYNAFVKKKLLYGIQIHPVLFRALALYRYLYPSLSVVIRFYPLLSVVIRCYPFVAEKFSSFVCHFCHATDNQGDIWPDVQFYFNK